MARNSTMGPVQIMTVDMNSINLAFIDLQNRLDELHGLRGEAIVNDRVRMLNTPQPQTTGQDVLLAYATTPRGVPPLQQVQELIAAAVAGSSGGGPAAPTSAPPGVQDTSAMGAVGHYATETHSHAGVTLDTAQTITAAKQFGSPGGSTGIVHFAGSSSGLLSFTVPATITSWTMRLPGGAGSNGQVLTTDGSGNTSWSTVATGGSGAPSGPAGGSLSGTYPDPGFNTAVAHAWQTTQEFYQASTGLTTPTATPWWTHTDQGRLVFGDQSSTDHTVAYLDAAAGKDVWISWAENNAIRWSQGIRTGDQTLYWAVAAVGGTDYRLSLTSAGGLRIHNNTHPDRTVTVYAPVGGASPYAWDLTLPTNPGASSGLALITNGSGTCSWAAPAPGGAAGGDLTGTYPNPTFDASHPHTWTAAQTAPSWTVSGAAGSVTLQVATTPIFTPWTLTLPINNGAGNSGYVLTTNGSGVTSWAPPGLGSVPTARTLTFASADASLTLTPPTAQDLSANRSWDMILNTAHANTWTVNQAFSTSGPGGTYVAVNPTAGYQGIVNFSDAGTLKWQLGKQTDNSFVCYDVAAAKMMWDAVSGSGMMVHQPFTVNTAVNGTSFLAYTPDGYIFLTNGTGGSYSGLNLRAYENKGVRLSFTEEGTVNTRHPNWLMQTKTNDEFFYISGASVFNTTLGTGLIDRLWIDPYNGAWTLCGDDPAVLFPPLAGRIQPAGGGMHIILKSGNNAAFLFDAAQDSGSSQANFRRAKNNYANPGKVTNGMSLGAFGWRGYYGVYGSGGDYSANIAQFRGVVREDWNDSAHLGLCIEFSTTAIGGSALRAVARFSDGLTLGLSGDGVSDMGSGTANVANGLYVQGGSGLTPSKVAVMAPGTTQLALGDPAQPTRMRSNLVSPTGLAPGDFYYRERGTTPNRFIDLFVVPTGGTAGVLVVSSPAFP